MRSASFQNKLLKKKNRDARCQIIITLIKKKTKNTCILKPKLGSLIMGDLAGCEHAPAGTNPSSVIPLNKNKPRSRNPNGSFLLESLLLKNM